MAQALLSESTLDVDARGVQRWFDSERRFHRVDGPAIVIPGKSEHWYWHGQLHREDGPAITHSDGSFYWYRYHTQHREDGPAAMFASGTQHWYKNGSLHREDGPAVMFPNGIIEWYLNNSSYSFKYFCEKLKLSKAEQFALALRYNP